MVVSKLEYAFSIGCTVKEACAFAMISTSAYYRFVNIYPELRDRFEGLRTIPTFKARKAVCEEIDRGNWRLAWRYLVAKEPQEFSAYWVLRNQNDALREHIKYLEGQLKTKSRPVS